MPPCKWLTQNSQLFPTNGDSWLGLFPNSRAATSVVYSLDSILLVSARLMQTRAVWWGISICVELKGSHYAPSKLLSILQESVKWSCHMGNYVDGSSGNRNRVQKTSYSSDVGGFWPRRDCLHFLCVSAHPILTNGWQDQETLFPPRKVEIFGSKYELGSP